MKNVKRMLSLLLALCMVLSLVPAAFAAETTLAAEDEVVIYYTNDVHTYIDGDISYDTIADLKTRTAEQAAGVLLVDAGDHVQGTAYGSMDKGDTIIELMNAAGYDLATLGNHEFDYGMEKALANVEAAEFPYVSANFYHEYTNPFSDVDEDEWYAEHVANMYLRGFMNGVPGGNFDPNGALTRAMFVTVLYRILGEPKLDVANPFTDVAEDAWYAEAVKFCAAFGFVNGTSETTFSPDQELTREQMATILWRISGSPESKYDLSGYTDAADISDWVGDAMAWIVEAGVINGTSETTLSPQVVCSRAMGAKVLDLAFYVGMPAYDTVLDAYKVIEAGGLKIAFIGITTPETFTKSTPAYFQDENGNYIYGIAGGTDGMALYDAVQSAIFDIMMKEAPDYIIGLAHLGDDPASQPWTSEELIANTAGLDIVIDGHSHSTVPMKTVKDAAGNDVILTQTGEYFGAIGKLTISEAGIQTGLLEQVVVEDEETEEVIDSYVAYTTADGEAQRQDWTFGSDEAVAKIKNDWMTAVDEELGEIIGYAEVTFDNYDAEGNRLVRSQETNTGDFAADALYYLFDNMDLDVDVAIMNGGGVRNKAITGEISYKTCKEIHTFGNVACLQTITGQQLLDALEWGARDAGAAECGGFLHVSGVTYEIDTSIASTVQKDDKGVWTGGPTGEYRVKNVKILQDGEYVDLDLTAKYNLAGYNYTLRDLGDGFNMFGGAVNVLDYVMEDYMVLANYVQSFDKGENGLPTITADNSPYENVTGEGRITLTSGSAEEEDKDIVILYTNDVHTYIDGELSYDNIADLKADLAETAEVLLVDAGDHVQGTAYGSMDKGDTIIELMNASGYDLATLGNHEFDYGMEKALANVEAAEFPYVSANFYHEANGVKGESVLEAYEIFAIGDEKIAFIGITTPETFTKSTPAYFQDENGNYIYGISGGTDGAALYADVQTAIDAAEAAGATTIIALGHLGDDPASKPWTSEELIANVTGLDAFIDGHSHSTVVGKEVADKEGNAVLLTQTGEYFGAIGKMTISDEGITTELITQHEGSDEAVAKIKNDWMTAVDEELGAVIGKTTVTFDNYDSEGNRLVRSQETNTGDFAADALYYLFDNMGLDVDVAIMNGGGVRNGAITGDISYKTCKEIHTFGNVACLQTITGQQLLDALEWGAKNVGSGENGGFLHVSGITYEIDTSIASTVQKDDKGVWTGGPTGEYRVKNVKILQDGEYVDLDLNAKYNLAGYNYTLRDLGDGFAMFGGAVNVLDYVMEDYMVLANYVQSFPDGIITADNSPYGNVNGEGRITIITAE